MLEFHRIILKRGKSIFLGFSESVRWFCEFSHITWSLCLRLLKSVLHRHLTVPLTYISSWRISPLESFFFHPGGRPLPLCCFFSNPGGRPPLSFAITASERRNSAKTSSVTNLIFNARSFRNIAAQIIHNVISRYCVIILLNTGACIRLRYN